MRTIFFGGAVLVIFGISQSRFDGAGLLGAILMLTASALLIRKELKGDD